MTRLRMLWRIAFAIGVVVFAAGLAWAQENASLDFVWGVIAFAVATIAYSAAFYLLCSLFAPEAAAFVLKDDVEVEGDNVVHKSTVAITGDEQVDFYARAYAAARGSTLVAVSTITLIGAVELIFGW